jgi:CRISPR-associated protein Cas1
MLSFVYDIADLYKAEITIPIAFQMAAESEENIESRIRHACRDRFHETKFLKRIVPDIQQALDVPIDETELEDIYNYDEAAPGGLWNPDFNATGGGKNWADEEE